MSSGSESPLARLLEVARADCGGAPADAQLEEMATLVRLASAHGAGVDEISAAGGLSVGWVRSVLDATDEPLRDRLGRTVWILRPADRPLTQEEPVVGGTGR